MRVLILVGLMVVVGWVRFGLVVVVAAWWWQQWAVWVIY